MHAQQDTAILFCTTQPAHVITIAAVLCVTSALLPNDRLGTTTTTSTGAVAIDGSSSGSSMVAAPRSKLTAFVYLASFVIHFGSQVWMTFVSGQPVAVLRAAAPHVRRGAARPLSALLQPQRLPQPRHPPHLREASSGGELGLGDRPAGGRHVRGLLLRAPHQALPDAAAAAPHRPEDEPRAGRRGRRGDRQTRSGPAQALPALHEDTRRVSPGAHDHRHGQHADDGLHGAASALHRGQHVRALRISLYKRTKTKTRVFRFRCFLLFFLYYILCT
uniref:Uncharacterized protein n=1 Tax=Trichogramma kaykai TaxID=54128 RepID=A0ABD2WFV6_9HYME